MLKHVHISKQELGLVFHKGDLVDILTQGEHRVIGWNKCVEIYDRTENIALTHAQLEVLAEDPLLAPFIDVYNLRDEQRGIVWYSGRFQYFLQPGLHVFFKNEKELLVETFEVTDHRFEHKRLPAILANHEASHFLYQVNVDAHHEAALFRDGQLLEILPKGKSVFWLGNGELTTFSVDLREQSMDVAGQEIMTSDRVTLRLNLTVVFRVVDIHKVMNEVINYSHALYREAQLALRAAVGSRALDKLLSDKHALGEEILETLDARTSQFGLGLQSVGVRDIILPGDMKELLNKVMEASKEAEANLIRRREETAATRSQINTARLMADNPVLMRMKELESLQDILKDSNTSFVLTTKDLAGQLGSLIQPA